jgi:hypothetical protein
MQCVRPKESEGRWVRGIGCADCLRDLRDSAQTHVPYIAQRMMTIAMSCRLAVVGGGGLLRQQARLVEGYLCLEVRAHVIRLEDVVVNGV